MNRDKLNNKPRRGRAADSGWPEFERDPTNRRRLLPGVVRKVQIVKEMNERHHEIARMIVLGYKNVAISKILKITKEFVSMVRNAPQVKAQVAILTGARDAGTVDVARQIQVALPKCVSYLTGTIPEDGIEDADISDALKSKNALALLAIGGHSPARNVNIRGVHAILTADDIKEIRDNAENVAIEIGLMEEEDKG